MVLTLVTVVVLVVVMTSTSSSHVRVNCVLFGTLQFSHLLALSRHHPWLRASAPHPPDEVLPLCSDNKSSAQTGIFPYRIVLKRTRHVLERLHSMFGWFLCYFLVSRLYSATVLQARGHLVRPDTDDEFSMSELVTLLCCTGKGYRVGRGEGGKGSTVCVCVCV